MNPTTPDPVIGEIREIRHRISAMCDYDPAKLVAYFQKIQAQYADRLITSQRFGSPTAAQEVVQPDTGTSGPSRATPAAKS